MRTTLNIDDDPLEQLGQLAASMNRDVSALLNDILAVHLSSSSGSAASFRQKTYSLGARPGIDFKKSLDLAARDAALLSYSHSYREMAMDAAEAAEWEGWDSTAGT
ncbi:MAG: hypothetical protein GVY29_09900 [Spirochaetes bacterium]|jgi:hypothetical protein|nr:hypothetical protein [Spirochaetota bacterium]